VNAPLDRRALLSVAAVVVAVLVYRLAFPDRSDYAGHFVAGAGGTLLLVAGAVLTGRPWLVAAAAGVAVLLGVGTEATVFRLAEFDPVDLANQSLGGLLAAAGFVGATGWRTATLGAVVAFGFLVAGFGLAFA
jgi:hypothetical protein